MQDDLFGWVELRDVAASDGVPVRDREARLEALFTKPNSDRLKQAQGIVAEGARFNLDPAEIRLNRTINLPLTALRFLRAADQHRSSFRVIEWDLGRRTWSRWSSSSRDGRGSSARPISAHPAANSRSSA